MSVLKDVFEVVEVLPVDGNSCRVIGRAYDAVRVDDILALEARSLGKGRKRLHFTVTAIFFHNGWLEQIDQGDTAHLTLAGEHLDKLRDGVVLQKS